jgi:hypothetical protein
MKYKSLLHLVDAVEINVEGLYSNVRTGTIYQILPVPIGSYLATYSNGDQQIVDKDVFERFYTKVEEPAPNPARAPIDEYPSSEKRTAQ